MISFVTKRQWRAPYPTCSVGGESGVFTWTLGGVSVQEKRTLIRKGIFFTKERIVGEKGENCLCRGKGGATLENASYIKIGREQFFS